MTVIFISGHKIFSTHTFRLHWPILIKLSLRKFYVMPLIKFEFHENLYISIHSVILSVKECLSYFPYFHPIWIKFVTGNDHKVYEVIVRSWSDCDVMKWLWHHEYRRRWGSTIIFVCLPWKCMTSESKERLAISELHHTQSLSLETGQIKALERVIGF